MLTVANDRVFDRAFSEQEGLAMSQIEVPTRIVFIRLKEVLQRTGLSRSTLYDRMEKGEFPKPLKVGERIACWPEHEITAWQRARLESARAGAPFDAS